MDDKQQLENALRRAHAAGDVEAAKRLARAIKAMQADAPAIPARPAIEEMTPDEKLAYEDRLTGTSLNPTDGNGFWQNVRIGAGKSLADTGRGLAQLVGAGPSAAEVDDQRRLDAPLMATGGGMTGNIGGAVLQSIVPVGGGARLASYAGRAAPYVSSGLRGAAFAGAQPVSSEESRGMNATVGGVSGVVGQGISSGANTLARGAAARLEPVARDLAKKANDAGLRLGLGQISDNPLTRTITSQLERLPFSGAGSRNQANQETFNELVGGTFGAKGKKITPDVFAEAKERLGGEFERLSAQNELLPGPRLTNELAAISDEAARLAQSETGRMVNGWVSELIGKAGPTGAIPGKAYQSFDSAIGKAMKAGGEPALYLGRLRDAVRGAMDDSISPADRLAWQTARKRYAALKTVEPLVAKSATGDIPPSQLMQRMTADKAGKSRMAVGNGGTLGELARIGQRFLKDAPNSGTADRLAVNSAVAGGLWGLQDRGIIDPETAAWTAAALLGNRAALKAINSRAVVQGGSKPLNALSRLVAPAPRLLPAAAASMGATAPMDIGTVSGYDPNDPRYRGD